MGCDVAEIVKIATNSVRSRRACWSPAYINCMTDRAMFSTIPSALGRRFALSRPHREFRCASKQASRGVEGYFSEHDLLAAVRLASIKIRIEDLLLSRICDGARRYESYDGVGDAHASNVPHRSGDRLVTGSSMRRARLRGGKIVICVGLHSKIRPQ